MPALLLIRLNKMTCALEKKNSQIREKRMEFNCLCHATVVYYIQYVAKSFYAAY